MHGKQILRQFSNQLDNDSEKLYTYDILSSDIFHDKAKNLRKNLQNRFSDMSK